MKLLIFKPAIARPRLTDQHGALEVLGLRYGKLLLTINIRNKVRTQKTGPSSVQMQAIKMLVGSDVIMIYETPFVLTAELP